MATIGNTNGGNNSGWLFVALSENGAASGAAAALGLAAPAAGASATHDAAASGAPATLAACAATGSAVAVTDAAAAGDLGGVGLSPALGGAVLGVDVSASGGVGLLALSALAGSAQLLGFDHNVNAGNNSGWIFRDSAAPDSGGCTNLFFGCNF